MDWLILYADGSTFSSEDGAPHEAPRQGVMQTFYCSNETGVSVEPSKAGIWLWRDGFWMGVDEERALWDYMFTAWPLLAIYGRTVPDRVWEGEVYRLTREIMGTDKSAWRARERRY